MNIKFLKKILAKIKIHYNRLHKKFLPRTLLSRMLLIIILPTMVAQVISTYIFYNKHWDNIRKYIIYTLSNEISLITNTYKSLPKTKIRKINKYTFLRYDFLADQTTKLQSTQKLPKEIRILKTNIEYNLPNKTINIEYNKKTKEVHINIEQISGGTLSFHINHKKLFIKSTYTFIFWMIGSSLVLLIIAILFAKNQIKSITRLSKVAHKLSKGQSVKRFIPHGAYEVRNAGHAFLKMKKTIEGEVIRKAEMLAWVSHDLRTPLTRMKLQLALNNKHTQQLNPLQDDIHQMEKIINDYLDFAKGDNKFKTKNISLSKLLRDVIKTAQIGTNIVFHAQIQNKIVTKISEHQLKRALFNLIDNAKRFGSEIIIKLYKDPKESIVIEIHDNGPGISKSEMQNVFKPFYRGDNYRNQRANGVGLGIPIASTIIKKHNGTIIFSSSPMGGLMITISLNTKVAVLAT